MARVLSSARLQLSVIALALAMGGCRGNKSPEPPVHLQQNMDFQKKFEAQEENPFFKDRRAMRSQLKGTIALGELRESKLVYEGLLAGKPSPRIPFRLSKKLLQRGQARYGIYCSRCHGMAGDGKGILRNRKITVPPTSYMEPRLRSEPVGHFYRVITYGIRNMPSLAAQIPVRDRWAIAAYVRVLQIAGGATVDQIPSNVARSRGWTAKGGKQ
jgi:mono/diheme cytochrome c family protein